jgi:hypothetical protein
VPSSPNSLLREVLERASNFRSCAARGCYAITLNTKHVDITPQQVLYAPKQRKNRPDRLGYYSPLWLPYRMTRDANVNDRSFLLS